MYEAHMAGWLDTILDVGAKVYTQDQTRKNRNASTKQTDNALAIAQEQSKQAAIKAKESASMVPVYIGLGVAGIGVLGFAFYFAMRKSHV